MCSATLHTCFSDLCGLGPGRSVCSKQTVDRVPQGPGNVNLAKSQVLSRRGKNTTEGDIERIDIFEHPRVYSWGIHRIKCAHWQMQIFIRVSGINNVRYCKKARAFNQVSCVFIPQTAPPLHHYTRCPPLLLLRRCLPISNWPNDPAAIEPS